MITEFDLGAILWKVKIDNKRLDDLNLLGLCEYSKSLITLHDGIESTELIEQTFYHELVHAILDTIGKRELSEDENFVQEFSLLLHQFEKTKR